MKNILTFCLKTTCHIKVVRIKLAIFKVFLSGNLCFFPNAVEMHKVIHFQCLLTHSAWNTFSNSQPWINSIKKSFTCNFILIYNTFYYQIPFNLKSFISVKCRTKSKKLIFLLNWNMHVSALRLFLSKYFL
jgi:hypothetical protein